MSGKPAEQHAGGGGLGPDPNSSKYQGDEKPYIQELPEIDDEIELSVSGGVGPPIYGPSGFDGMARRIENIEEKTWWEPRRASAGLHVYALPLERLDQAMKISERRRNLRETFLENPEPPDELLADPEAYENYRFLLKEYEAKFHKTRLKPEEKGHPDSRRCALESMLVFYND
jgi:hypothetical protein